MPTQEINAEELIIDAFCDGEYQNRLNILRLEIETELKKFLLDLKKEPGISRRIFDNVESRVKSTTSFKEKIKRKGYIASWLTYLDQHNKANNQEIISKKLPDLIGFRINCFFFEDEREVYERLKKYSERKDTFKNLTLDFPGVEEQDNGHLIYKLKGTFSKDNPKSDTKFELQIKSLFHNLWGEVDHRTIYKGVAFDPDKQRKKIIIEQLFNILSASDKQLMSIFEQEYTEEMLLQALFYTASKEKLTETLSTPGLAIHYEKFFILFASKEDKDLIRTYLGHWLLKTEFNKKHPPNKECLQDERDLLEKIKDRYIQYSYEAICAIASELYELESLDDILTYLIQRRTYGAERFSETDHDTTTKDAFDDEEEDALDQNKEPIIDFFDKFFVRKAECSGA